MKQAIELLKCAGLLHTILATSAVGAALIAGLKENIFKMLFWDIALVEQAMNVDPLHPELITGAFAEQFVGQEMLALVDPFLGTQLFFWSPIQGFAEVDYLMAVNGFVIPIEVKAGKEGTLKSLHLFLKEKQVPFGVRISQAPLGFKDNILSVPFYMIAEIPRLILSLI